MKNARQEKILELIRSHAIDRQETLIQYLRDAGFDVTQATVSRDIRQLHLLKTPTGNGQYRYAANDELVRSPHSQDRFETIFRESVLKVDYAGNTLVVKCFTGMANATCALFDAMEWDGVVGTLSGDDTFFTLMRTEESARLLAERLQHLVTAK